MYASFTVTIRRNAPLANCNVAALPHTTEIMSAIRYHDLQEATVQLFSNRPSIKIRVDAGYMGADKGFSGGLMFCQLFTNLGEFSHRGP